MPVGEGLQIAANPSSTRSQSMLAWKDPSQAAAFTRDHWPLSIPVILAPKSQRESSLAGRNCYALVATISCVTKELSS